MSNVYELGDLLVTREYGNTEKVEICVYKGVIGSLFLTVTTSVYWHMERFVRNCDSLAYSTRIIRAKDADEFLKSFNPNQVSDYLKP